MSRIGTGPESAHPETVLVVDDEVDVADLARDILEAAGYTVVMATSGEEALAMLARQAPPVHLVLSDVAMPGMSGVALKAQLAKERPDVDVLLTSGLGDRALLRHGGMNAIAPFLGKPYSAAELMRAVREVLDARRGGPPGGTASTGPGRP